MPEKSDAVEIDRTVRRRYHRSSNDADSRERFAL